MTAHRTEQCTFDGTLALRTDHNDVRVQFTGQRRQKWPRIALIDACIDDRSTCDLCNSLCGHLEGR